MPLLITSANYSTSSAIFVYRIVSYQTSRIRHQTSDIVHQTSDIAHRTSDIIHQTLYQTSYIRHSIRHRTSDTLSDILSDTLSYRIRHPFRHFLKYHIIVPSYWTPYQTRKNRRYHALNVRFTHRIRQLNIMNKV